jgi:hypothetical protein
MAAGYFKVVVIIALILPTRYHDKLATAIFRFVHTTSVINTLCNIRIIPEIRSYIRNYEGVEQLL